MNHFLLTINQFREEAAVDIHSDRLLWNHMDAMEESYVLFLDPYGFVGFMSHVFTV